MNGIIFCVCSTSAISVTSIILKRCRKERKKMQVKKKSQQNQSRWWIRCREFAQGIQTCLPRLHQKARETKSESQNVLLGSLNVQQTSSGRPVDVKFVIDDDMDSDTATESNHSLRLRYSCAGWMIECERYGPLFNRCNARYRQTFFNLVNVFEINIGSICIHGKELLRKFTFHQEIREQSHFETDVRDIWKVDSGIMRWDFWSVSNQLGKFSMETIIFGQWWRNDQSNSCKGLCNFRFCFMSWKGESEPNIKYCLGTAVGMVQRFITILKMLDTIDGKPMEFEWNMYPGITTLQLVQEVRKFVGEMGEPEHFQGRIIFMSMFNDIKFETMKRNALLIPHLWLYLQKDFEQDIGHSSDLDQKRSGIRLTLKDHKENGTKSLNWWWWSKSEKADTQFSEPHVHCLEERSKAKDVENCQYTSVPMEMRLKLFFAHFSVNQLSIYRAVSDLCEEYSAWQTRTGRPVPAGQSEPVFEPANLLRMTLRLSIEILAQEI